MPVDILTNGRDHAWATWKISENESDLADAISASETVPDNITNAKKRLEFYAGRVLLKSLLDSWGLPFHGLTKDAFGKPFFKHHNIHLSLTHSFPYVAAVINRHRPAGIDLEQPKAKLLSIAHRILQASELQEAGQDIVKHCIYWCGKESLIKIHGKKDLTFAKNLLIEPFHLSDKGALVGRIIVDDISETVPMQYRVYDNFVLVITT